jgi:type VI secretion system VasD/TssJ family lipoprotein
MRPQILWAAALGALAACTNVASGGVRGIRPLNVNDQSESNSVDVRFYQLKDDARFKEAPVEKLWTDDKAALGEDLLAVKTVTIFPGTGEGPATTVELGELPAAVRFVGVLALFSKEDKKGPRKLVLSKDEAKGFALVLTEYHIAKGQ